MVESYAGMVSLPHRHPAKVQAQRQMELLLPVAAVETEAGRTKLLEWNLYLQSLYNHGPYLGETHLIPLSQIRRSDPLSS